jgi:endonuclease/exonuclease/phosphatase (EEP) superfamily protein YafD
MPGSCLLRKTLYALCILSCVLTLTGWLGGLGWLWDLTSHFRVHYLGIQLMGMLGLLWLGIQQHRVLLGWVLACACLNFLWIVPYLPGSPRPLPESGTALKVLHLNVCNHNRNFTPVIERIQSFQPDVLSLQEVSEGWYEVLERAGVFRQLPYRALQPGSLNGLYTRYPLHEIQYLRESGLDLGNWEENGDGSIVFARMKLPNGGAVSLVNLHTATPITPRDYGMQIRQLKHLKQQKISLPAPTVLVGDLNMTMWSQPYRLLTSSLGLVNVRRGMGVMPSWPVPLGHLGIPIDHILVSPEVGVQNLQVGPGVSSDHAPVMAELQLPDPSGQD